MKRVYSGGSPAMTRLNAKRHRELQSNFERGRSLATNGQRPERNTIKTVSYKRSLGFIPSMPQSLRENLGYLPPKTDSFRRRNDPTGTDPF